MPGVFGRPAGYLV